MNEECCKNRDNWERDYERRVDGGDFQLVCKICGYDVGDD